MKTNFNKVVIFITLLFAIIACSVEDNDSNKRSYVFMSSSTQWPIYSGDFYCEITGDDFYFMEDIFVSNFKKLYHRKLNTNDVRRFDDIIVDAKIKQLSSKNIKNIFSESATEYHLTLVSNSDHKNIHIFQDKLSGDFAPIIYFLDSLHSLGASDTIFCISEVSYMFIDGVINLNNDTIRTSKQTNFCLWKHLMSEELLEVRDTISITKEKMDYSFDTYYDLGFVGDSIIEVGVLDDNLYLFFKSGLIKKVNGMPCSIEPLLY